MRRRLRHRGRGSRGADVVQGAGSSSPRIPGVARGVCDEPLLRRNERARPNRLPGEPDPRLVAIGHVEGGEREGQAVDPLGCRERARAGVAGGGSAPGQVPMIVAMYHDWMNATACFEFMGRGVGAPGQVPRTVAPRTTHPGRSFVPGSAAAAAAGGTTLARRGHKRRRPSGGGGRASGQRIE